MVNLMHLGAYSIIFLMLLGFISNQNPTALTQIGARFNELTCPLPLYRGVDHPYSNSTFNNNFGLGNITITVANNGYGSQYICSFDPLSAPPGTSISVTAWNYSQTTLAFPSGWFVFAAHTISEVVKKVYALFELMVYFLTPINFEILGYTLADLGGFALMSVVTIYIFCYVMIAIMIYKIVSPFAGVG